MALNASSDKRKRIDAIRSVPYGMDYIHAFKYKLKKESGTPLGQRLLKNLHKRATKHLPQLSVDQFRQYLGCDADTLINHLQSQFTKRVGFCWQNYATVWEIDHVIPINKLKDSPKQAGQILHFKNLQPLTKAENEKKKARYNQT